jgi:hypothetical protein
VGGKTANEEGKDAGNQDQHPGVRIYRFGNGKTEHPDEKGMQQVDV